MKDARLTSMLVMFAGLTLFSTLAAAGIGAETGADGGSERPRAITVSGEAVVKVEPDTVILTFGVETWDKDIMRAKEMNQEIVKKTFAVLKEGGVAENQIQTDYLSIQPRFKNDYARENFLGYAVTNNVAVTVTDPQTIEDLLTKILQAGITSIHGIEFQTSEFKAHRERARELALLAAKEKAEKMAAALGQTLGRPLTIQEVRNDWWFGWRSSSRYSGMSQNVIQNAPSSPESEGELEAIALGKISIRANVSVTFELSDDSGI